MCRHSDTEKEQVGVRIIVKFNKDKRCYCCTKTALKNKISACMCMKTFIGEECLSCGLV